MNREGWYLVGIWQENLAGDIGGDDAGRQARNVECDEEVDDEETSYRTRSGGPAAAHGPAHDRAKTGSAARAGPCYPVPPTTSWYSE